MLICDKRRPRMRGDTNIRPPQGGQIKTAPPASGPRLRRSPAWGGTPPPLGCPLARLRAPGPRCLGHPAGGGSGHGCDGGGGGQPLAVVHARRLALAVFGLLEKFKAWAVPWHGGGSGAPPVVGRRWATRPRRWAARVQPLAAVPAVHGLGEVVHGRPGYRAHLFGRALEKTGVFLGEPRKAVFPGCGSESALRVFNWKLIS